MDVQLKTSVDGVYALGDNAQYASTGDRTLPYVMPLMNAAKVLGAARVGRLSISAHARAYNPLPRQGTPTAESARGRFPRRRITCPSPR